MAELSDTPSANRIRIAFFGLRNAGKSTLVNAFCGQQLAIVSDVPGTTTDPVTKAMEILPLGPCLITDTAGLDDSGPLGEQRVRKTLEVLAKTDLAVWVGGGFEAWRAHFNVPVVTYRRGDSVDDLKKRIAALEVSSEPGLLDGLVKRGDRVLLVCPIDASAPKGRLILPQVQVLRACLDKGARATVCQPDDLPQEDAFDLVVTDSQAFASVQDRYRNVTSFSILFARQKGDLKAYEEGLAAARRLKTGDVVLIAEGCTHHRQCNDIGSVKIPKALSRLSGGAVPKCVFASGGDFDLSREHPSLVVHCGGCMLTRREVQRRIAHARAERVPMVNYGILLQAAAREK